MANEEQLSILRQNSVVWNKWRVANPKIEIDLRMANLEGVNLVGANLSGVNLMGANLRETKLPLADLSGAHLRNADLSMSLLSGANLREAKIMGANLRAADLSEADLSGADVWGVNLMGADLGECNFTGTYVSNTAFGHLDLSRVIGLEQVHHMGPSTIGIDIIAASKGKIPEKFLRGCGLSDADIEYSKLFNSDLTNDQKNQILYRIFDLRASQAIQVAPLFISYSHGDTEFVNKIDRCLTDKGVRFWRDIHDLKAGRIEKQIAQAISQDRIVLLVLSENSLKSDWVEHEVRKAREIAKNAGRDTLCPVALDDSWKDSRWPARIMEQIMEYNILDFSEWQDDVKFEAMFRKLIDGLQLFYKG